MHKYFIVQNYICTLHANCTIIVTMEKIINLKFWRQHEEEEDKAQKKEQHLAEQGI